MRNARLATISTTERHTGDRLKFETKAVSSPKKRNCREAVSILMRFSASGRGSASGRKGRNRPAREGSRQHARDQCMPAGIKMSIDREVISLRIGDGAEL